MRLFFVVEGQTEEAFIKQVLAPHLLDRGIYAFPTIVGTPKKRGSDPLRKGGGDWPRWERDLRRILGDQPAAGVRVTTLFDLYGLPRGFPGLKDHGGDGDTQRRCYLLQAALAETIGDARLMPYIQRHEFEALVLAALPALRDQLDASDDLNGHDTLVEELSEHQPEDINDGAETAPSKRLLRRIPSYRKTIHGPRPRAGRGTPFRPQSLPSLQ